MIRPEFRPERLVSLERLRSLREDAKRRDLAGALAGLVEARAVAQAAADALAAARGELRESAARLVERSGGQPQPAEALHAHSADVAALRDHLALAQNRHERAQQLVDQHRIAAEKARQRLDAARRAHDRLRALRERLAESGRRIDERLAELADDMPIRRSGQKR